MRPPPPASTRPARAAFRQRRAKLLLPLCLAGLATPYLNGLTPAEGGRASWLLDLMTHWQWLFAAGLLAATAVLTLADRRWTLLAPLGALPFVSAAPALPNSATSPSLAVASANIHVSTRDPRELLDWLGTENPDVVVVLEVSRTAAIALDRLQEYPFRIIRPDDSPFGIALLSRLPIESSAVLVGEDGVPHIQTTLAFGDRMIAFAAFHPVPPTSPHYHNRRNELLHAHVQTAAASATPAILAGDLNATPWSSAFKGMEELGWRRATGLLPTWPAWGQGVFGIPIDHVLASSEWRVVERKVGPPLGSDHLPVLVKLALMNADQPVPATAQWKPVAKAFAEEQTNAEPR